MLGRRGEKRVDGTNITGDVGDTEKEQGSIAIPDSSARLSHPEYAFTQTLIDSSVSRLRVLASECCALERRMLVVIREDESENTMAAYNDRLTDLAQTLKNLSHLLAYQYATNVSIPKADQARAVEKAEELSTERGCLLDKVKDRILVESKGNRNHTKSSHAELNRAAVLFSEATDALSSGGEKSWPGKIDYIVVRPPRTNLWNTVRIRDQYDRKMSRWICDMI